MLITSSDQVLKFNLTLSKDSGSKMQGGRPGLYAPGDYSLLKLELALTLLKVE